MGLRDLCDYLRQQTDDAPVLLERARAYHQAALYGRAVRDLDSARRSKVEVPPALEHRLRGDHHFQEHEWQRARAAYARLLATDPPDADALRARIARCDAYLQGKRAIQ